ncbi:DUF1343 domain-containing protein [soil metagenome]
MNPSPCVQTGLDALAAESFRPLRGRRVGAICNPTSVDGRLRHLADHLQFAEGVELVALFGPEHGVRADAQDMIGVGPSVDSSTGVPIHSLYGDDEASLRPRADQLEGLDILVFDVQDVGSRYYTFAATMLYAMEAAEKAGLSFLVLDRPNPIGGETIEGPTVQPGFESFVGAHPVPIRHGLTVGELALLFKAEKRLDLDLKVIPCQGWRRSMLWPETGLPWVLPSPNMPTWETALVYPGACLIEGTNLSEGRGTTRPFELWGATWLDPDRIATGPDGRKRSAEDFQKAVPIVPGVRLRPCAFEPSFHKHAGRTCFGLQPHVEDPRSFQPVRCFTILLAWARTLDPARFGWRTKQYEFRSNPIAIDLLYGSSRERKALEAIEAVDLTRASSSDVCNVFQPWQADEEHFRERRVPFLLYGVE